MQTWSNHATNVKHVKLRQEIVTAAKALGTSSAVHERLLSKLGQKFVEANEQGAKRTLNSLLKSLRTALKLLQTEGSHDTADGREAMLNVVRTMVMKGSHIDRFFDLTAVTGDPPVQIKASVYEKLSQEDLEAKLEGAILETEAALKDLKKPEAAAAQKVEEVSETDGETGVAAQKVEVAGTQANSTVGADAGAAQDSPWKFEKCALQ
mmetsp:Transcript_5177/g.13034  ORF Transcript_5177/g.13034 Transcript_5177/m.13034 type:complete len:208 (+) Transcript_5177:100-723(+)